MSLNVLVLAGTAEARELCSLLATEQDIDATASLAGVTSRAAKLPVSTRVGGFGGASGLAEYLRANFVDLMIDATHPFAARITRNAVDASEMTAVRYLRLERPEWKLRPGWKTFSGLDEAMEALPDDARPFLATGSGSLNAALKWKSHRLVLRVAESTDIAARHLTVIAERPPFTLDAELQAFRHHRITHLIVKNAGGATGEAKLDAADALGIQVFMIQRPKAFEGIESVATPVSALEWTRRHVVSAASRAADHLD